MCRGRVSSIVSRVLIGCYDWLSQGLDADGTKRHQIRLKSTKRSTHPLVPTMRVKHGALMSVVLRLSLRSNDFTSVAPVRTGARCPFEWLQACNPASSQLSLYTLLVLHFLRGNNRPCASVQSRHASRWRRRLLSTATAWCLGIFATEQPVKEDGSKKEPQRNILGELAIIEYSSSYLPGRVRNLSELWVSNNTNSPA